MNDPKCPTGRSITAHEKGLCDCDKRPQRSALVQAMLLRNGPPRGRGTIMKDRRTKRAKDARRSWRNEEH